MKLWEVLLWPWYCTHCGQRKPHRQAWCCIMDEVDPDVLSVKLICLYLENSWGGRPM